MSNKLYEKLDARRAELEARLLENGEASPPTEQAELEKRLKTLHDLLDRRPPRHGAGRLTQVSIAVVAASIVAAGLSLRLSQIQVQLEAKATELTFTTSGGSAEAREFANPEIFKADNLQIWNSGGVVLFTSDSPLVVGLVAYPDTEIAMRAKGPGCFLFGVKSHTAIGGAPQGLSLTILETDSRSDKLYDISNLPFPVPLEVEANESLHLCIPGRKTTLMLAGISSLELWREHTDRPPRIATSTLTEGKLRIAETGDLLEVGLGDKLSLRSIHEGWLMLTSSDLTSRDEAGITFSGLVEQAELVGMSPETDRQDLAPSLARFVSLSPNLTWLWGILTGAIGVLWVGWRFLFPSS